MKAPLFFCDNCGAEVGRDLRVCPFCGRIFTNVRCPACDFSGTEEQFARGCPSCGYSSHGSRKLPPPRRKEKKPLIAAEALPLWVYILASAALTAVLALLVTVAFR